MLHWQLTSSGKEHSRRAIKGVLRALFIDKCHLECTFSYSMSKDLQQVYPVSSKLLPLALRSSPPDDLPRLLRQHPQLCGELPFLADLAEIELAVYNLTEHPPSTPSTVSELTVHPGIELLSVGWAGLPEFLQHGKISEVTKHATMVLLIPACSHLPVRVVTPTNQQLLALKIAVEHLDRPGVAREGGVAISLIDRIIAAAVNDGLLLAPVSTLVRSPTFFQDPPCYSDRLRAEIFTLQWHITQACDLHCRHCYDRSSRDAVSWDQGEQVLDQFHAFCLANHVAGQISFTGGNPLLHPQFDDLYLGAVERGFMTAILGNPVHRQVLERIVDIQMPEFFQVSLEGLREHNDYIRGAGHFDRVLEFLDLAREMKLYSMVMLTLTRDNMKHVLPLAEELRGRTDLFTFNRLAMTGEGAALASPSREGYEAFLQSYLDAAADNPIMSTKDSLFNIILERQGQRYVRGGCAGFGCGAAFNFVSLLPDGEVHACRKLPSLLGNLYQHSLKEIYRTPLAEKFREGSSACRHCRLRPVCRGCPAVVSGLGGDILNDIDPCCFIV